MELFGANRYNEHGEWAAIPFYRPADCIPADFNLLDFFDPAAFACPSYVSGFEIWKQDYRQGQALGPVRLSEVATGAAFTPAAPAATAGQPIAPTALPVTGVDTSASTWVDLPDLAVL